MINIFSSDKNLNRWPLGSRRLNTWGLHGWRMKAAAFCTTLRVKSVTDKNITGVQQLIEDGVTAIPDFLPEPLFKDLRREAGNLVDKAEHQQPARFKERSGFGEKLHRPFGFDRYDGGTLNRFITFDADKAPFLTDFSRNQRLSMLTRAIVGHKHRPEFVWLYQILHGDEGNGHDPQKDFHRDTFFSSMKFWFFLKDVKTDDGPFEYCPGSHILTPERLAFEQSRVMDAVRQPAGKRSSSFRISRQEIKDLGIGDPVSFPIKANTLLIANTLGFHRRGDARQGATRLSVYGNLRPWPFGPIGR